MRHKAERRGGKRQELHRGCGTVEFFDPRDAFAAQEQDHHINGDSVLVRYYYSEEERKRTEMAAVAERRKVHVDGVPPNISKSNLLKSFFGFFFEFKCIFGRFFLIFQGNHPIFKSRRIIFYFLLFT